MSGPRNEESLVESAMHWTRPTYYGVGSGGLAGRLDGSLAVLKSLGVRVPAQCRARSAAAFFKVVSENPIRFKIGDPDFEQLLQSHDRTARDLFLIACAAYQDARNPQTPFTVDKLEASLFGPDVDEGRHSEPRSTQFELTVAAMLRIGGLSVYRGAPDLTADIAGERVGIEAKRIRSLRDDQFGKNVKDAVAQIEASGRPGYIALGVDGNFRGVDPRRAEAELIEEFSAIFDSLDYRRASAHSAVFGAMLLGWGSVLTPSPPGRMPLLSVISPMRWERWSDDREVRVRFREFFLGWSERVQRNRAFMMSPEFGTRPM